MKRSRIGTGALRLTIVLAVALTAAACAASPEASADDGPRIAVIAVPTQEPRPAFEPEPQACPMALLEGRLVRHPEFGVGVQGDPDFPPAIAVWPHGWTARDVDGIRELLDADGNIVAREGDFVSAGGGSYPPRDWFRTCGPIEVRRGG